MIGGKRITQLAVLLIRVKMELLVLIVRIHINAIAPRVGKETNVTRASTTALLTPVRMVELAPMVI